MRNVMKTLLFVFILIFGITSVYSAGERGACCYVPNSDRDIRVEFISDTCPASEIFVGRPDFTANPSNGCFKYEQMRQGCVNGPTCSALVRGSRVYDIPGVKSSFNFNSFCSSFKTFDNSCIGNSIAQVAVPGGGQSTGGGGVLGNGTEYDGYFENTTNEEEVEFCANAGGPFGFFVTELSCESLVIDGNNSCLFNPYLGGKISSNLEKSGSSKIKRFENACIPKSEINECIDYKTRQNCEENPSKAYSDKLRNGCEWIPTSDFSNSFDDKTGICIANNLDPQKYFDDYNFAFRKNTLLDPSFEMGGSGWNGDEGSNIVNNPFAYHGHRYYILDSVAISQEITGLAPSVSYSSTLYARGTGTLADINFNIKTYDFSDVLIDEFSSSISVGSNESKIFRRYELGNYVVPEDVKKIVFELSSTSPVEIDAVSFETSFQDSVSLSDSIFKPVEIIPSSASKCEYCYEGLNLNLCTEQKSSYLGDCSYMVEDSSSPYSSDLGQYLGKDANSFSENDEWASQSLANSQVFCEMYIEEQTCTDPANYVNSKFSTYHSSSAQTLCKWNDAYGCFKDSDNNGFSDTLRGIPLMRAYPNELKARFNSFADYAYDSENNLTSDFMMSCDTLPPNTYIYFKARNASGDEIVLTQSSTELVGNLVTYIDASDTALESCVPYNISPKLYVDYEINGAAGYRIVEGNRLSEIYPAKDYFANAAGTLVEDGTNLISIELKDQSGNLGKEWSYSFNIDASGPNISLISPSHDQNQITGVLGPGAYLNFSISDYSEIRSCSYSLTPLSNVPSSYYTASAEINTSDIVDGHYKFELPIYNTSANSDVYRLSLECVDIFDQNTTKLFSFLIDHNTEIVVVQPLGFRDHELNYGFLNVSKDFIGASTDRDLQACTISFEGDSYTGTEDLDIVDVPQGFELESSFPNTNFYKSIEGDIAFSSDGVKKGTIRCEDVQGNVFTEDITYYYDTKVPEMVYAELIGRSISGVSTVAYADGKFYTDTNTGNTLRVRLDGTGSWIKDNFTLELFNNSGQVGYQINPSFDLMLNESSFLSTLDVKSFEIDKLVYLGVPQNEKDLYKMNYLLSYKDKSGNSKTQNLSYFLDNSRPSFNFSGDISNQDGTDIYTAKNDPNIIVNFNAPSYRKYTCTAQIREGSLVYQRDFVATDQIQFSLSQISSSLFIDDGEEIQIDMDCTDVYGKRLAGSYRLLFDDTAPVLKKVYLASGNNKYFKNYENVVYEDLVDDIVYEFANTNEKGYKCEYRIRNVDDLHSCNTSMNSANFANGVLQYVDDVNFIKGNGMNPEPVCVRTQEFFDKRTQSAAQNLGFDSKIYIETQCQDKVGLKTQSKNLVMNVKYYYHDLVDFEFRYEPGKAYPVVRSFTPFESVAISFYEDGRNSIMVLQNPKLVGDMYVYEGASIDLSAFNEGEHILFAVASNEENIFVSSTLVVDTHAPEVGMSIPDEVDGVVIGGRFQINYESYDYNGEVGEVVLRLGTKQIYNSNGTYDPQYIETPDEARNYFSADRTAYYGSLVFNGSLGQTYDLRLEAKDNSGNFNSTGRIIHTVDGLSIRLLNSENSYVDMDGFSWVSNAAAPVISFKTSEPVSFCMVYPMKDQEWVRVTGDNDAASRSLEIRDTDTFSFDLSGFAGYDLSQVSDSNSYVEIQCREYDKTNRTVYKRNIQMVNSVPDYVLSSSNGFIFNEEPFSTFLTVKSVGAYRYLNCKYKIDDEAYVEFNEKNSSIFRKDLSLESINTGEHTLYLQCSDVLGNPGPLKEYDFIVDKSSDIAINDLKLIGANEYTPVGNEIYISEKNLDLEFTLNKKNNVYCDYVVSRSGNVFNEMVNFFKNLFGGGRKEIQGTEFAYQFRGDGLSFSEGENTLRVDCNSGSADGVSMTYDVIYGERGVDVNSQRIAIN